MWTTGYIKPAGSALVPVLFFLFVPPAWSHCGSLRLVMGWEVIAEPNFLCLLEWHIFFQPANVASLLFLRIHEKDGKIKSVEELLQAEILKVASKEKTVQVSLCNPCLPFCVDATTTFVCYCLAFYTDQFVASIFCGVFVFPLSNPVLFCHWKGFDTGNRGSERRSRKFPAWDGKTGKVLQCQQCEPALPWMCCSLVSVLVCSFSLVNVIGQGTFWCWSYTVLGYKAIKMLDNWCCSSETTHLWKPELFGLLVWNLARIAIA